MAELATRATNVKCLESAGVLELLRPLLSDSCSTVRQCAVVAAARLAEHEEGVARQLLNGGMVTITLENLNKYNVYYKRSALYLMRAVAKHNEELAASIVRLGALEHIVSCLEDFDTQVKENAAWALGYIGKHSEQLAGLVVDAGTLPMLVLAFQEPEMSLKQISAGALVDLAQHKPEAVVDAGAICHLVHGLENQDPKLKRSTLCALGAVASSRTELAEAVVAGGALPAALLHAGHDAAPVRRAAACLLRDIVKHSVDLAQLVVNTGGCGPLVELLEESVGGARVPACMALGFIAGQSDQLAMAVIESKAIPALVNILQNTEAEDAELCAAAWTMGHIAKHSPQHSLAIAVANALPRMLQLYTNPKSSGEVRARTSCALKQSLQCCLHRPALEPLLHSAPAGILKYVLGQYAKILPNDARARRLFVTTGALKRVQEIDSVPGSSLKEYINIINSCFPEEIVRFIISIDNAPYHSVQIDKAPTSANKKADLVAWLQRKGVDADMSLLKAELLQLVKLHKPPKPTYVIDQLAEEHGHKVIRLPPYHCQYNAIELIWAQVKGYAARHNTKPPFSVKKMEGLLKEACAQVTQEDWSKVVQKTKKIIMDDFERDVHFDNVMDNQLVINLNDDDDEDDDTSTSSE